MSLGFAISSYGSVLRAPPQLGFLRILLFVCWGARSPHACNREVSLKNNFFLYTPECSRALTMPPFQEQEISWELSGSATSAPSCTAHSLMPHFSRASRCCSPHCPHSGATNEWVFDYNRCDSFYIDGHPLPELCRIHSQVFICN